MRILPTTGRFRHTVLIWLLCQSFQGLVGQEWRGAELRSLDSYLYGRFEVRFKPANGDGLVASFFTYNDLNPSTPWNEIDLEILGRYSNILDFVTITSGQNIHKHNQFVSFDPHLDFHTYAFEWTPDYVAWFVDGQELFRQTQTYIPTLSEPQKIMMNIWLPIYDEWVGPWDERILPRFSFYDFVSYASFTPDSGSVGTDGNFTPEWIDNFDQFDDTRWEKSHNHTWPGNLALLVRENIVYENGNMILCLTQPGATGYVDNTPPAIIWARAATDQIVVRFSEELDSLTATSVSNYVSGAGTITGARLWADQRTVALTVPGIDLETVSSLMALNIQDTANPSNTAMVLAETVINPQPLAFPIKINVGGTAAQGYLPDEWWLAENEYGREDGSTTWVDDNISGSDEDSVYAASANRLVTYGVRVPAGRYRLTLKFSENYYDQTGDRTFDIFCEDSLVVENLDVFAQAGQFAAYDIVVDSLLVLDGAINIVFSAGNFGDGLYEWRGATLSGVVIEQLAALGTNESNFIRPEQFKLHQNYPNPFNPVTTIRYDLPTLTDVSIGIYDLLGRLVFDMSLHDQPAGKHSILWNGTNYLDQSVSAGVYLYQIKAGSFTQTRKMVLLK